MEGYFGVKGMLMEVLVSNRHYFFRILIYRIWLGTKSPFILYHLNLLLKIIGYLTVILDS